MSSVCIRFRIFIKSTHVCAGEIAKQRPDMNIKVAAFTVSEKSNNTYIA